MAPIAILLAALLVRSPAGRTVGCRPCVYEDPEITKIRNLWMWFWISLIGIILGGIGIIAAGVLFFIIFHKSWKLTEHEGSRANADTATAWCFIPGWGYYWMFPAFRGLAREFNDLFDKHNIVTEKIDLRIPTWMLITLWGSAVTFGVSLIAFIVLWIIYTNKIKNAYIAVLPGQSNPPSQVYSKNRLPYCAGGFSIPLSVNRKPPPFGGGVAN